MRAWGSPDKYIQGRNVFKDVSKYVGHLGQSFSVLIDPIFEEEYMPLFSNSFKVKNKDVIFHYFEGEITSKTLDKFFKKIQQDQPDVIMAVGGGKLIDVAKNMSSRLNSRLVICPTLASTDAPTSAMSIIYDENNEFDKIQLYYHNPDIILVDSAVIAQAPLRFFISGIGDALSTYFEGKANRKLGHCNYVLNQEEEFNGSLAGFAIAKECYRTLRANGVTAVETLKEGGMNDAVENVIESNILMSGLGFENAGCSIAHAIGNGMTALPNVEKKLHGERVGFGTICQVINDKLDQKTVGELLTFMAHTGVPITLDDLQMTKKDISMIASAALKEASIEISAKRLNQESVVKLIETADELGRKYK